MKYATPQAFERALSDRLKRQSAEEGIDLDRLRKRIAFERFLARLTQARGGPGNRPSGQIRDLCVRSRASSSRRPNHRHLTSGRLAADMRECYA